MTIPVELAERISRIFPAADVDEVLASFSAPRVVGLRVNPLRGELDNTLRELETLGITPTAASWSPTAFWAPPNQRSVLTHSQLATDGRIYVQNLASQLAAVILAPQPGETVLDLAAAPGGKTSHLAALMVNRGTVSAVEPIRSRFFKLRATLDRMGVTIAKTYMIDGRAVAKKTGPRFDRVLLDAPCSAESRVLQECSATHQFWSARKIKECSKKQRGLIRSAFQALKPGGKLLYCTCTFAPEENEAIVAHLLKTFPDQARVEPLPDWIPRHSPGLREFAGQREMDRLTLPPEIALTARLLPNEYYEGHYIALISKTQ